MRKVYRGTIWCLSLTVLRFSLAAVTHEEEEEDEEKEEVEEKEEEGEEEEEEWKKEEEEEEEERRLKSVPVCHTGIARSREQRAEVLAVSILVFDPY